MLLLAVPASEDVLLKAAQTEDWRTFASVVIALALLNVGAISFLRASLRRVRFFRSGLGARVLAWVTSIFTALLLVVAGGVPPGRAVVIALISTSSGSGAYSWRPKRRHPADAPKEAAP